MTVHNFLHFQYIDHDNARLTILLHNINWWTKNLPVNLTYNIQSFSKKLTIFYQNFDKWRRLKYIICWSKTTYEPIDHISLNLLLNCLQLFFWVFKIDRYEQNFTVLIIQKYKEYRFCICVSLRRQLYVLLLYYSHLSVYAH